MIDFASALLHPGQYFQHPTEVLQEAWTAEQKYKLLRQWKYDLGQLDVAADENMADVGASEAVPQVSRPSLAEIHAAMESLGYVPEDDGLPTKGA